jgi:hypothetical protein
LQALLLAHQPVEIGAGLLDLIVERAALRRLVAEQREKSTALAAQALSLLIEAVEVGLLTPGAVLGALDLGELGRVGRAAVKGGELAFEAQAR